MLQKNFGLVFLTISIILSGCNSKSFGMIDDSSGIQINRFDSVFYHWVDTDDKLSLTTLINDYPQMLGLLGKSLFQTDQTDSSTFFDNLKKYYSEPTLKSLYNDAVTYFATNSPATRQIEQELSYGFKRLQALFPSMQIPAIYMHVSGLQQNMIVADSLLSFSIDKYLGSSYPLYKNYFYDFQLKSMTPERVAVDGLNAWFTSEFPFTVKEPVLLDRLIYEGKIIYVLTQTGFNYPFQQIVPLTENEYNWCLKHESTLWKTLINRKHLTETDALVISKYFNPAPSSFIAADAPGYLGNFIGYRIVSGYMKQTKSTCEDLIRNNNAQEILKKSKYKP